MEKKMRTIKNIWRWEWAHEKSGYLWGMCAEAIILLFVLVAYIAAKSMLFRLVGAIMQLPEWLYVFLGVESTTRTGNFTFYLLYAIMFVNAWNAWRAGARMVQAIDRDLDSGSIYMICNQWYDRRALAFGRFFWNLMVIVVWQSVLYMWALLLAMIGSLNREQRIAALGALAGNWCKSLFVILLFAALSFFYAVNRRRRPDWEGYSFRSQLFWLPFWAGNLYKVKNAVFAVLELLRHPVAGKLVSALAWMKHLYWLSPLSWMNPFHAVGAGFSFLQCALCLVISALAVVLGVREYREREYLP